MVTNEQGFIPVEAKQKAAEFESRLMNTRLSEQTRELFLTEFKQAVEDGTEDELMRVLEQAEKQVQTIEEFFKRRSIH